MWWARKEEVRRPKGSRAGRRDGKWNDDVVVLWPIHAEGNEWAPGHPKPVSGSRKIYKIGTTNNLKDMQIVEVQPPCPDTYVV
jgi:hypothetical protein